jgi:hypothetical protein
MAEHPSTARTFAPQRKLAYTYARSACQRIAMGGSATEDGESVA